MKKKKKIDWYECKVFISTMAILAVVAISFICGSMMKAKAEELKVYAAIPGYDNTITGMYTATVHLDLDGLKELIVLIKMDYDLALDHYQSMLADGRSITGSEEWTNVHNCFQFMDFTVCEVK